jgi:hypothetical protein
MIHTARAPVPVQCGFALIDDAVYFGSDAELWRYHLPALPDQNELKDKP